MNFLGIPMNFIGIPRKFLGIPKKFLGIPKLGIPEKFLGIPMNFTGIPKKFRGIPRNSLKYTLRRSIIVPGGLIMSPGGGPGTGFCSPGGGFSDNRRNGKPLRLLRLKNHPRDYKNQYQDHQDHPRDSLLAPPGRLLTVVE